MTCHTWDIETVMSVDSFTSQNPFKQTVVIPASYTQDFRKFSSPIIPYRWCCEDLREMLRESVSFQILSLPCQEQAEAGLQGHQQCLA